MHDACSHMFFTFTNHAYLFTENISYDVNLTLVIRLPPYKESSKIKRNE